jgi:hypothetical protein
MKKISVLVLLVTALIFVACGDLDKTKHLKAIAQMEKSLDSMDVVLKENRLDTLAGIQIAANSLLTRIKTYYSSDTVDVELGKKMDQFKRVMRSIKPKKGRVQNKNNDTTVIVMANRSIGNGFSVVHTGVREEKLTLAVLKKDIENGNGRRDKYAEYIKFEQDKVHQLQVLLKAYVDHKNLTIKEFNEIYSELNAYSLELMEKKKP